MVKNRLFNELNCASVTVRRPVELSTFAPVSETYLLYASVAI